MARDAAALIALLAGGFALLHRRALAGDANALTEDQVRAFASGTLGLIDNPRVDEDMIVRIAWIESAFDASAVRPEPQINDASAGLMQTLVGTADWLASQMGYTAFGKRASLQKLMGPQASIYYGAAYLDYLSDYAGQRRSEEFMVRSYNGGPGNFNDDTAEYWRRYLEAKARFG